MKRGFAPVAFLAGSAVIVVLAAFYFSINSRTKNPIDSGVSKQAASSGPFLLNENPYEVDNDCRFDLKGDGKPFVIVANSEEALLILENQTNGFSVRNTEQYPKVKFLPNDPKKGIIYGASITELLLLNKSKCETRKLIKDSDLSTVPGFKFNKDYFVQNLLDISPEGKLAAVRIYEGSIAPHFPGTEKNFSQTDASLVGLWTVDLINNTVKHVVPKEIGDSRVKWNGTDFEIVNPL